MRDLVAERRLAMLEGEQRHFEVLFSGILGQDYTRALNDATEGRHAEALGARTRLGSIVRMLPPLFRAIRRRNRLTPWKALDQYEDLVVLLFTDALAATVIHQRAGRLALTSRKESLDRAAAELEQQISSLATGLHDAAELLREAADASSGQSQLAGQEAKRAEEASQLCTSQVAEAAETTSSFAEALQQVSAETEQSRKTTDQAVSYTQSVACGIERLSEMTNTIGSIVTLIQEIASKTNLLALNATIEAARAGSSGKGFAVVASEVKVLASQTAKATEDIAMQIASVQAAATECVTSVKSISHTIASLDRSSKTIADTVASQSQLTAQIASAAKAIALQARSGLVSAKASKAAIAEVAARSCELGEAARGVDSAAASINSLVGGFLKGLRRI